MGILAARGQPGTGSGCRLLRLGRGSGRGREVMEGSLRGHPPRAAAGCPRNRRTDGGRLEGRSNIPCSEEAHRRSAAAARASAEMGYAAAPLRSSVSI